MSLNLPDLKIEAENVVVGRILLSIHKALDEQFPHSMNKDAKFIKTVFSDEEENTVADRYRGGAPTDLPAASPANTANQVGASMPPSDLSAVKGPAKKSKDWLAVFAIVVFVLAMVMVGYVIVFL